MVNILKAFIFVTAISNKVTEAMEDIVSVIRVKDVTRVAGLYDIVIEIDYDDVEELNRMGIAVRKLLYVNYILTLYSADRHGV